MSTATNRKIYKQYLLTEKSQMVEFEKRMGDKLNAKLTGCFNWLAQFPLMEYFDPMRGMRDEALKAELIQTICYLAWGREIKITFSEDMYLMLQPRTEEEWIQWMKNSGWHGAGIDADK